MNAHHYLGFRPIVGQSLWYVATCEEQWVALLGWGAAALSRPQQLRRTPVTDDDMAFK
jgi:hypothetical protein